MTAPISTHVSRSAWRNPLCVIALGFGAGALPKAPGTWGTLAALPFYVLMARLPFIEYIYLVTALFIVGIWICGEAGRVLGAHDHSAIVWDEMVGFWVTMAAAPPGWLWIVVGFILFRFFDICKPWPIYLLDRRLAGGFGVMADDLVAGLYAALCVYLGGAQFGA
jgi:phosphatidylglycerophosphatase A